MSVVERVLTDDVLTVRLNRPETLNAISLDLAVHLREALQDAAADERVRCVVLTGAGRGFCAGADLGAIATEFQAAQASGAPPSAAAVLEALRAHSVPLIQTLHEFPKPLVAAVNGPCAGAGLGIALAADVIVAAHSATFTAVFMRRGLVPDYGVTHLLPRLVGLRLARELCLLADGVPASRAVEVGLVAEAVPDDELDAAAGRWARRFADGPAVALRLTKRLLADTFQLDAREAVERELAAQALCLTSQDALEGVAAFLERRPPRFGRA